ncbi:protein ALP1-like [Coffea eugenioides]|uniref:Protein ALP1-like n=1 Tax=Coffea arabica TaxID=13443 RepID=A0A6P6STJ1_COFAR|nr:protein ALP1-like [Coffea arabica]XP_027174398.1 protein ALP1-like [Coffea eugenioides]
MLKRPVRGQKKRKEVHKKLKPSNMACGSSEKSSPDWFDALAKKIASNLDSRPSKGLDSFKCVFKMSRRTFEYICSLAREHMAVKTHFAFSNGKPMSLYDQVALALNRLSSGRSLVSIGDAFGTSQSTVSQVTWRFVEAIEMNGHQHIRWPSTENELMDIKSQFEQIQGLPNCCGAIDTTHIVILLSTSKRRTDVWLDSKENYSMPLQAIVGPNLKFLDIFSGLPGMLNESSLLPYSSFYDKCQKGERLNGKKIKLSQQAELQEYVVGDSAYPLLPWLLTPYQGNDLSQTKVDFNKHHLATRVVAQRALARLKDVWKMIDGVVCRPDKHKLPSFIFVCCILHNIVIDMEDEVLEELPLYHCHDPGYGQDFCDSADVTASVSRDNLALYLSERNHP